MTPSEPGRSAIRLRQPLWIGAAALAVMLFVALLSGTAWWIGGPIVSSQSMRAILGANKDEVRRVLGDPSEVMYYGDWIYDRPPNPGWVAIKFDHNDRVSYVNDEQVFPEIFGSESDDK